MGKFNLTDDFMKAHHCTFTANEIHQQPTVYPKTIELIKNLKNDLELFINEVINQPDYDIILAGAGTSEFVGNSLFAYLNKKYANKVKSYGTTDITQSPENYIHPTKPTILVNFARSGNSPESVGSVALATLVNPNIKHLFITCNVDGALAKYANEHTNAFAINLSPETHDQSFAMTSSYTNMLLACLLTFNLEKIAEYQVIIDDIIAHTTKLVNTDYNYFNDLVNNYNFNRIVYLGANTLKGVSQESALKMLELSAGKCVTMYDTPLGFRHGPKSIINDETLTVVYVADYAYIKQYEVDLIKEMAAQRKGNKLLIICNQHDQELADLADFYYTFNGQQAYDNVFLGLQNILVAQLIALYKSLQLGITPDNPCPTGEVNRVVQGVTIYTNLKEEK